MKILKAITLTIPAMVLSGTISMQAALADSDLPVINLFKSPTCGCCAKWAERAIEAGFTVKVTDTDDMASVKKMAAVPDRLQACHTASVGGYIVEGHVPLADVKKLLNTKPEIRGIAVPGMPAGSPGMEYGNERQAFKVVTFGDTGPETVFQSYPAN